MFSPDVYMAYRANRRMRIRAAGYYWPSSYATSQGPNPLGGLGGGADIPQPSACPKTCATLTRHDRPVTIETHQWLIALAVRLEAMPDDGSVLAAARREGAAVIRLYSSHP